MLPLGGHDVEDTSRTQKAHQQNKGTFVGLYSTNKIPFWHNLKEEENTLEEIKRLIKLMQISVGPHIHVMHISVLSYVIKGLLEFVHEILMHKNLSGANIHGCKDPYSTVVSTTRYI